MLIYPIFLSIEHQAPATNPNFFFVQYSCRFVYYKLKFNLLIVWTNIWIWLANIDVMKSFCIFQPKGENYNQIHELAGSWMLKAQNHLHRFDKYDGCDVQYVTNCLVSYYVFTLHTFRLLGRVMCLERCLLVRVIRKFDTHEFCNDVQCSSNNSRIYIFIFK